MTLVRIETRSTNVESPETTCTPLIYVFVEVDPRQCILRPE